jgi:glutamyl/glutaminyl-tRNA synthetase
MSLTQVETGEVMSKRKGTFSVANYRELGYLPEGLVNYLALLGWSPRRKEETFAIDEVLADFRIEDLTKSPGVFDREKLDFVAGFHLRRADPSRLAALAKPFLVKAGFVSEDFADEKWLEALVLAFRDNMSHLSQIVELSAFLFEEVALSGECLEMVRRERSKTVLKELLKKLEKTDTLSSADFRVMVKGIQKETGTKGKELYMPIRAALTGAEHGPELVNIAALLGIERCVRRLERALEA